MLLTTIPTVILTFLFVLLKQSCSQPTDYRIRSSKMPNADDPTTYQRYSQYSGPNRIQESLKPQPNPAEKIFRSFETCEKKCVVQCYPVGEDNEIEMVLYLCRQVRPLERSLKDRLLKETSWPWLMFLTALGGSLVFCIICTCWSCCCRRVPTDPPRHHNNGINGINQDFPHDLLGRDLKTISDDDGIQTMPLRSSRNGTLGPRGHDLNLNAHKRVADV